MRKNGWKEGPVDVVRMPDGTLASTDNRRLYSARRAGIEVQARVRGFTEPLNKAEIQRFTVDEKGHYPKTWGEALMQRAQRQPDDFSAKFPYGTYRDPRVVPSRRRKKR